MDERKKTTGCAISKLPSDLRYDSVDHFKDSTTLLVKCVKNATSDNSDKGAVCFAMYHTRL